MTMNDQEKQTALTIIPSGADRNSEESGVDGGSLGAPVPGQEESTRRSHLWRHLRTLGVDLMLRMAVAYLQALTVRKQGSGNLRAQRIRRK